MLTYLNQILNEKSADAPAEPAVVSQEPASLPQPPGAANINAEPQHMGNPAEKTSPAVMQVILQRFLQDFEYVSLKYENEGSTLDPLSPIEAHSHIVFRMCGDDRKALTPDQTNTYLSRQIDRGSFILKKFGFETDSFYVDPHSGELAYDLHVPKDKMPEGASERDMLEDFVDQMQKACTEARANRMPAAQLG